MTSPEPETTVDPNGQAEYMQQVCEAFLAQDALAVIVSLLAEPLSRHPKMTERDIALTELVITFLRNLLRATEPLPRASAAALENARRVRIGLVERLFTDNVLDLLLLIAQHGRERPFKSYATILLELFLYLFTGTTPEGLLQSRETLSMLHAKRDKEVSMAAKMAVVRQRQHSSGTPHGTASSPSTIAAKKAALFARMRSPSIKKATPALPSSTVGRTVTRFGPHGQQFAGAVYVRRHFDHSNPVVVRHKPNRTELPTLASVTNPRLAKAQKLDAEAALRVAYAGGASDAATAFVVSEEVSDDPSARPQPLTAGEGAAAKKKGKKENASTPACTLVASSTNIKDAEITVKLKDYLDTFLQEAYTPLVGQVFREARPGLGLSMLEEDDFERYVRFVTFCLQYVRLKEEIALSNAASKANQGASDGTEIGDGSHENVDRSKRTDSAAEPTDPSPAIFKTASPFECVSATMGWDSFHLVQVLLQSAESSDLQRAREKPPPPPRPYVLLHSLCPLLREMLLALDLARIAGNESDQAAADRLQRRLLHDDSKDSGLLPSLTRLMKNYSFQRHPRTYAVHLVECLSLVLGTLDRLALDPGGFKLRQKARRKSKKKKSKKKLQQPRSNAQTVDKEVDVPIDADGATVEQNMTSNPTSNEQEDQEQYNSWMSGLTAEPAPHEKSIMSREDDKHPNKSAATDDLQNASAPQAGPSLESENRSSTGNTNVQKNGDATNALPEHGTAPQTMQQEEERDEDDEEEESEDEQPQYKEVDIDLPRRLRAALAYPSLVHFHMWVLEGYRSNRMFTNHAIVSFLDRIALPAPHGLGLEPMLWQLSVLRIFHTIMADACVRQEKQHARLLKLCTRVVRNLFERLVPDLSGVEASIAEAEADLKILDASTAEKTNQRARDGPSEDGGESLEVCDGDGERPSAQMTGTEEDALDKNNSPTNAPSPPTAESRSRDAILERLWYSKVELEARRRCASLGFVELLFWKGAPVADAVAHEYNWRRAIESETMAGQQRRATSRNALGDDDGCREDEETRPQQLGFASFEPRRRPGHFTHEQKDALVDAFERCNGRKDCLDILVTEMNRLFCEADGDSHQGRSTAFKKTHIARKLKELGLKKGKFTERQDRMLQELLQMYDDDPKSVRFEHVARDLGAGFSARQVQRRIRALEAMAKVSDPRSSPVGNNDGVTDWDKLLGSDDDVDEEDAASGGDSDFDFESEEEDHQDGEDEGEKTYPGGTDIDGSSVHREASKKRKSVEGGSEGAEPISSLFVDPPMSAEIRKNQVDVGVEELASLQDAQLEVDRNKNPSDDARMDDLDSDSLDITQKRAQALELLRHKKQKAEGAGLQLGIASIRSGYHHGEGHGDVGSRTMDLDSELPHRKDANPTLIVEEDEDTTAAEDTKENVDLSATHKVVSPSGNEATNSQLNAIKSAGKTFGRRLKRAGHGTAAAMRLDLGDLEDF